MSYMINYCYRTRCGEWAIITDRINNRLIGKITKGPSLGNIEWNLDGKRIPIGGECPYDLEPTKEKIT